MLSVCGSIFEEDQDVVHIDDEPSFIQHVAKDVIYECLEDGG